MKTIKNYFFLFLLGLAVYSCQKNFSPETIIATQSTGSLAKDASGNCLPVTVNGIYKKDSLLNATHYIDVSVNVTAIGSYLIRTDTTNGIYFKDSAAFAATGLQTVRLKGYGKPVAAGITSLTVQYNGSSSCAVQLMVTTAGISAAAFTLAGAPGNCTSPVIEGTYTAGTALNATNKIQLNVIVTATGDYTLSTTTVNGISFSATGTFTSATPQTVTLSATGTPVTAIPTILAVTGAPAGCSFTINVNSGTSTGTQFIGANVLDTSLAAPFDTIGRFRVTYDALNRPVTVTELSTKANGDSLLYTLYNFTYNGSDTFAKTRTRYERNFYSTPTTTYFATTYFTFLNEKCLLDSTVYSTGFSSFSYSYVNNTVKVQRRNADISSPNIRVLNSTVYQTFTNGNNTYQLDTLIGRDENNNNPATFDYFRYEFTSAYLPNPDPFRQVNKVIQRPHLFDEIGFYSRTAPKNLLSHQTELLTSWHGTGPHFDNLNTVDYIYSFRPDGYPLIAWSTLDNIGTISKRKTLFFYR
ncbi:MAG: hypothetical protein WBP16_00575 [Ferruginibacter sp.]